jgi:hypothetical protein
MDIGLGQFEVPALCTRRSDLLDALLSALPPETCLRLGHDFESFEHQVNRCQSSLLREYVRSRSLCEKHDFVNRRRWYPLARPFSAIGSPRTHLPRLHRLARAGAILWALFQIRLEQRKHGDVENASASSTPVATASPGTPPRTTRFETMSTLPKAARVNSCGCSRAGTSR